MAGWLSLWVVGMFGFGYALVPLYDIFCEITGLNGKSATLSEVSAVKEKKEEKKKKEKKGKIKKKKYQLQSHHELV